MEDENENCYLSQYKAALHGDWITANRIFDSDSNAPSAKILGLQETVLHVIEFVQKLVDIMSAH